MGTENYRLEEERHSDAADKLHHPGVAVLKLQEDISRTYLNRLRDPNLLAALACR